MNTVDYIYMQCASENFTLSEFETFINGRFKITEICELMRITRNHYYYLQRTNQLTFLYKNLWEKLRSGEYDHEINP